MNKGLRKISTFCIWVLPFIGVNGGGSAFAWAATKVFSGSGDGSTWHDEKNWFPEGVPGLTTAVTIDKSAVFAVAEKDFLAQSVTVGGKASSQWTSNAFVYGTVAPATTSDPAVFIRKGGTVVLKGSGTVTLKGPFKNSEESLPGEDSVLIWLR